ncbi:IS701 family transposase [Paraburkholderia sp. 22B1P]|jgi:SRSO17 transposase|uniref:IS701 family transposase n=1 Tax=Paraburkholderia sp. 22B1P TaxID=3080498 RepID=UPI0030934C6B|nr:IS701 family transposase [Paraburkholderia sp. 22B1P]
MSTSQRFDEYLEHLSQGFRHKHHIAGLRDYCTGLMRPLERKSTNAIAEDLQPARAAAMRQALHHFVARAPWCDEELLRQIARWVTPQMAGLSRSGWWVIGCNTFPKRGSQPVGVARQHHGASARYDKCQIAVSVSLACESASLPVGWRLYLPRAWADDPIRRRKAGVPNEVQFASRPTLALQQIERLLAAGTPSRPVLADVSYGMDPDFRQGLIDLGLPYVLGVTSQARVWRTQAETPPSTGYRDAGRTGAQTWRTAAHYPVSVRALAMELPAHMLQTINWREGNGNLRSSRFGVARVQYADNYACWTRLQPLQWLLLKWPVGEPEPVRYWLSTLPEDTSISELVAAAHYHWRTDRDHEELRQDFGLDHYSGRGWRGFHHHATLCTASYGFHLGERLASERDLASRRLSMYPEPGA